MIVYGHVLIFFFGLIAIPLGIHLPEFLAQLALWLSVGFGLFTIIAIGRVVHRKTCPPPEKPDRPKKPREH